MNTAYQARFWSIAACLLLVTIDYFTKSIASQMLRLHNPVALFPWFDFLLVHNSGAAFSFLADQQGWQRWFLLSVSVIASCVLLIWMWCLANANHLLLCALTLITSGAIGNAIDRAVLGYVIDFIALHYQHHYFPAFNVADSAVSVGTCLLLIDALRPHKRQSTTKKSATETSG